MIHASYAPKKRRSTFQSMVRWAANRSPTSCMALEEASVSELVGFTVPKAISNVNIAPAIQDYFDWTSKPKVKPKVLQCLHHRIYYIAVLPVLHSH